VAVFLAVVVVGEIHAVMVADENRGNNPGRTRTTTHTPSTVIEILT
jgi:hypothetical protein